MIKKLFLGAVSGGLIVFMWSAVSWMALPWHKLTMEKFMNEAAVSEFMVQNAPKQGVYLLPWAMEKAQGGPLLLAAISPEGPRSMGQTMVFSLLVQILGAFFVTFLVLEGKIPKYRDRAGCAAAFAFAAGVVCYLPNWIWWGVPLVYTVVNMLDLLIGWFLAGLAIAKIAQPTS